MTTIEKLQKEIVELDQEIDEAYHAYATATNRHQEDAYWNRFTGLTQQKMGVEAELQEIKEIEQTIEIMTQTEQISK